MKKNFLNISKKSFSRFMKMGGIIALLLVSCNLLLASCSRDDEGGTHGLKGTIFTQFAGEVSVFNLTDNKFTEKVAKVSGSDILKHYDISWDGKKVLFVGNKQSTFANNRRIMFRDISLSVNPNDVTQDGKNIHDFYYEWYRISNLEAFISPNEQYIALRGNSASDMPTIVIKANSDVELGRCEPSNVPFGDWGKPQWTFDNTLYVQNGNSVYRMRPNNNFRPERLFTKPSGSAKFSVNKQGTKFVFRMNKHLYMCNIDGSGVTQVTKSRTYNWANWDGDDHPVFSPDGKYIAFTTRASVGTAWTWDDRDQPDGWTGVQGGKFGYIAVIPADGKLYDLNASNSGVIPLLKTNKQGIPHSGHLVWR